MEFLNFVSDAVNVLPPQPESKLSLMSVAYKNTIGAQATKSRREFQTLGNSMLSTETNWRVINMSSERMPG